MIGNGNQVLDERGHDTTGAWSVRGTRNNVDLVWRSLDAAGLAHRMGVERRSAILNQKQGKAQQAYGLQRVGVLNDKSRCKNGLMCVQQLNRFFGGQDSTLLSILGTYPPYMLPSTHTPFINPILFSINLLNC